MRSVPSTSRNPTGPLAGARILVVDDHAFSVSLIKDVLDAAGAAAVLTTRDGESAIRLLRTFKPSLVLTDWKMPEMDGLRLTRIIRQAERLSDPRIDNPQIPVVLLTGHVDVEAVEQARLAGVNEVVVKPFSTAALIDRLAASIARPRQFVVTEAYIGPDRRRRAVADPPARRRGERLLALAAPTAKENQAVDGDDATSGKTSVLARVRQSVDVLAAEKARTGR
jgi:CheY-like chemotaxis protein